jgi:hypothetical protein
MVKTLNFKGIPGMFKYSFNLHKNMYFCSLNGLRTHSRTQDVACGRCHILVQHGRNPRSNTQLPDPPWFLLPPFCITFLSTLQLTINNNGTAINTTSSRILFKRQVVDIFGVGARSFGVQVSCKAVPGEGLSFEGMGEEEAGCSEDGSINQGRDYQAAVLVKKMTHEGCKLSTEMAELVRVKEVYDDLQEQDRVVTLSVLASVLRRHNITVRDLCDCSVRRRVHWHLTK